MDSFSLTDNNSDNLAGMSAGAAKEYIHGYLATLKLTERAIRSLEEELAKWNNRMELARARGMVELVAEAEKEAEKIKTKLAALREEERTYKKRIEALRLQLPGLAARERSIDADLLEQELLMALGRSEENAETERAFRKLEKEGAADSALQALKEKMNAGRENTT